MGQKINADIYTAHGLHSASESSAGSHSPWLSPLNGWPMPSPTDASSASLQTPTHDSMLVTLSNLRLIAHYWVGPIAIITHVACGLRMVLLQHDISPPTANRLALALITVGV